eukprot:4040622-Pyramimonas_sp.AAC.1
MSLICCPRASPSRAPPSPPVQVHRDHVQLRQGGARGRRRAAARDPAHDGPRGGRGQGRSNVAGGGRKHKMMSRKIGGGP